MQKHLHLDAASTCAKAAAPAAHSWHAFPSRRTLRCSSHTLLHIGVTIRSEAWRERQRERRTKLLPGGKIYRCIDLKHAHYGKPWLASNHTYLIIMLLTRRRMWEARSAWGASWWHARPSNTDKGRAGVAGGEGLQQRAGAMDILWRT